MKAESTESTADSQQPRADIPQIIASFFQNLLDVVAESYNSTSGAEQEAVGQQVESSPPAPRPLRLVP